MPESFGARLRRRREERQMPLAAVADETKIKLSLLEALERDDVSQWPAGIFRRAFVRAYAHAIGFDPDVAVREFLEHHPDPGEPVETVSAGPSETEGARTQAPPTRLRHIVGSAIGSLSRRRPAPPARDGSVAGEPLLHPPAPAEPDLTVPAEPPVNVPPSSDPDLEAVARLCTALGRVEGADEVQSLLQEAAGLLGATGLVVWLWDALAEVLRPALTHGYSATVVAQLPAVTRDADNATAAAYRLAQTCVINGTDHASGALAVPLLTPSGCAGVLALELPRGAEQTASVRAAATILAALLAQLTGRPQPADLRQSEPTSRRA